MPSQEVVMGLGLRVVLAGAVCAASLIPVAASQAGPPALLAEARYVALGYDLGAGFVSASEMRVEVLPEERAALERIRGEIEAGGRYDVVLRPGDADLLIAIRKGRRASVGANVGSSPTSGAGGAPAAGVDAGASAPVPSPDDTIEVFDKSGVLVWRETRPKGLSGAGPPLWDAFRSEVLKVEKRTRKP
jgi:hypothetical protein